MLARGISMQYTIGFTTVRMSGKGHQAVRARFGIWFEVCPPDASVILCAMHSQNIQASPNSTDLRLDSSEEHVALACRWN